MADLSWWQTTLSTALGAVSGGAVTIAAQFLGARQAQKERRLVRQEETELEHLDELREAALAMLSAAGTWRAVSGLREQLINEGRAGAEEEIPTEVITRYTETNAAFHEALRHTLDPTLRTKAEEFLDSVASLLATRGPGLDWIAASLDARISIENAIDARYRELHGVGK